MAGKDGFGTLLKRGDGAGPEVFTSIANATNLSGPNLSKEIAARQPAASVVACADEDVAVRLQRLCHTATFRPYTNTDVVGCELGGATKNVIALAVGMASGLGFGDNAKASVITRGLAGLGDLVATCSSPLSRNRTFGEKLGHGMSVEEVQESTRQTAEGVKSCRSVLDLARAHDIDVPITEAVVRVCHEGESPARMVKEIMSREAKPE